MQLSGMDTVFYMVGMRADGTGEKEIFTYHTRFTKQQVEAHVTKMIDDGAFDELQQGALKESAVWLSNSLHDTLKASLHPKLALRPTGPVLWMMIVAEVQSDSLQCTDLLVEKFKKLALSQYKGEDVGLYCDEAELILLQLEKDDQLPRLHLMTIVDVFSAASVLDFKVHWMGCRAAIHSFIKESAGKSKDVVASLPNHVHFSDLLQDGKELFHELQEGGNWGSTGKASPEQTLLSSVKTLNAKVAQLDQQLKAKGGNGNNGNGTNNGNGNGNGNKRRCYNCNSEEHLANACPKKNKDRKDESSGSPPAAGSGKWSAPKEGEPHQKMINGTLHYWCSKCRRGKGRWTKDHLTSQHQDGFIKKKKEEEANNTNGDGAPAVRMAHVPPSLAQTLFAQWSEKI